MTLARWKRIAHRWWPAPIAVIVYLSHLLTWYQVPPHMLSILLICVGLATARALPLPSLSITAIGALVAPFAYSTSEGGCC